MRSEAFGFTWTGEVMKPIHKKRAADHFVEGHLYFMEEMADTSERSMRHEFAWLRTAWMNLPEALQPIYPTPEHLRKRALIEAGFFDETAIDCGSPEIAARVAIMAREDSFALVFVEGSFVLRRRAKSQSRRAMNADQFQESKSAIMGVIADLIGVSAEELARW